MRLWHKDKTRVQMPAKMFPHLKLLCWLFMGPTLGFNTKQRNSSLIKCGVFNNKSKILTILFIVKCEKITLLGEFLVLLGAIISRFFACLNGGKNIKKTTTKGACSSPISMGCGVSTSCRRRQNVRAQMVRWRNVDGHNVA
jgi:hypothetical protein